jgi:multisubunit Na+/H+ antiporter MnhG subunit
VTYATGTWAIGNNGMYLLLGSLRPFDDALFLTEEGVPRWLLFVAGFPLVAVFLALFTSFLGGIGLRRDDSYWRWMLTVETGLLSYLGMIVALRALWPREGSPQMGGQAMFVLACSPLVLLLLASCTYPLRHLIGRSRESRTIEPCWTIANGVLGLGLLFMFVEMVLFC